MNIEVVLEAWNNLQRVERNVKPYSTQLNSVKVKARRRASISRYWRGRPSRSTTEIWDDAVV